MRALLVEDDALAAARMEAILQSMGHEVSVADDGATALSHLQQETFELLVTDWMLPGVDGLELVRRVRRHAEHQPLVVVVTALDSQHAREHAISSGADAFLGKPVAPQELRDCVEALQGRNAHDWETQLPAPQPSPSTPSALRAFPCALIAASTGAPPLLQQLLTQKLPPEAAYLVVLHAPTWAQESLTRKIDREGQLPAHVVRSAECVQPGHIYFAPGDQHLEVIERGGEARLRLSDAPPEHHCRPAANRLFRSGASVFGSMAVGLVLTGLGADGADGARSVEAQGGQVIVQDPDDATAASMPRSALCATEHATAVSTDDIAVALGRRLRARSAA